MLNIIKADLYKFFKSKTFFVVLLIAFLFATLILVGTYYGIERMGQPGGPPPGAISTNLKSLFFRALDSGIMLMLIAVSTSIFIAGEYTSGIIKDTVSSGRARSQIFLSKIIVTSLGAVLLILFYSLYQILGGSLFLEYGTPFNLAEFWILARTFIFTMVSILAINALFATITTAFKSLGTSLGVNIGLLMFGQLIFLLISLIHEILKDIGDYFIVSNITSLLNIAAAGTFDIKTWLIALGYLTLSIVVGLKIFARQDIK